MNKRLSQLWEKFRQPFTAEESVNIIKSVLDGAKTLEEQGKNLQLLKPLVEQSNSLLDVLCSPLAQVVSAGLPFLPIGIALLKAYREKTRQEPTLEECVLIVSQAAYLESVKEILSKYPSINWDGKPIEAVSKQLKELSNFELDYEGARDAILCFHESKLAVEFNKFLSARLQVVKFQDDNFINRLIQRIARNTHRYIIKACINSGDILKNMPVPSFGDWRDEEKKFKSIDKYLDECIAKQPDEQVFEEEFKIKDIYVPLKAKKIDSNGKETTEDAFDLKTWAEKIIEPATPNKSRQVMFIQAGPGGGKSVFCRMFAYWVWLNLHPVWTPILIRLRDIKTFDNNFENTLKAAVDRDFAHSDNGWLNDRNTRFLFLLDGFDELVLERKTSEGLKDFLKQVADFQDRCQRNSEKGHQVLITGRPLALQGIERLMPDNLDRVQIQLMDDEIQQQWFNKWLKLVGAAKTSAFQQFLKDANCPDRVQELSREPLLMYLLAAMHRDGEINGEMFKDAQGTQAKILIYKKTLDWVLTKQRPAPLNRDIAELETEDLRQILKEAGLCVIQSGGEIAPVAMIEERLQDNTKAKALIERAKKNQDDKPLRQALATFYMKQAANGKDGSVEFAHKSFGEFLGAEKLAESFEEWTQPGNKGKEFYIETKQMHEQIYDLLGYGGLTWEIVEYLMELLKGSEEFRPVQLFQRLQDFYTRWCGGEFIDAVTITLPQKKAQQLQKYDIQLGQRQVDIYAGLNVMILLLELHRYGRERDDFREKIIFYPSGQPKEYFLTKQLLCIINYSDCIQFRTFNSVVRQFLSGVDLHRANLSGAYLNNANLSGADLSNTNLSGASFRGANLRSANLRCADLSGADLSNTNLSSADLSSANFHRADLQHTDLRRAYVRHTDLHRAYLSGANLSGANLSGANLRSANLSGVNLSGVNLSGVNLRSANLSGANLSSVNLSSANLSGADLHRVNLRSANLSSINLSSANLSGADLSGADLSGADLSGANLTDKFLGDSRWDEKTNWENVQGLETAVNLPEGLKQQLGLT